MRTSPAAMSNSPTSTPPSGCRRMPTSRPPTPSWYSSHRPRSANCRPVSASSTTYCSNGPTAADVGHQPAVGTARPTPTGCCASARRRSRGRAPAARCRRCANTGRAHSPARSRRRPLARVQRRSSRSSPYAVTVPEPLSMASSRSSIRSSSDRTAVGWAQVGAGQHRAGDRVAYLDRPVHLVEHHPVHPVPGVPHADLGGEAGAAASARCRSTDRPRADWTVRSRRRYAAAGCRRSARRRCPAAATGTPRSPGPVRRCGSPDPPGRSRTR